MIMKHPLQSYNYIKLISERFANKKINFVTFLLSVELFISRFIMNFRKTFRDIFYAIFIECYSFLLEFIVDADILKV